MMYNIDNIRLSSFYSYFSLDTPKGIRIPVTSVKGRCPRPLDDGGLYDMILYDIIVIVNKHFEIILNMENILAKLYLLLVFLILFGSALFLALQIHLTQKLAKNVNIFRSKKNSENESYQISFKLGQIYLRRGNYTQAIEEFRACLIECDRNDRLAIVSLLNTLGFTYNQLCEYDLALQYYSTALLLEPGYITCQNNLAYLYRNRLTRQCFFDWEKVFEESTRNLFSELDITPPENIEDALIPIYRRLISSTYNTTASLTADEFREVLLTFDDDGWHEV